MGAAMIDDNDDKVSREATENVERQGVKRRETCQNFSDTLQKIGMMASRFSEITGASRTAVYRWKKTTGKCTPPQDIAIRFLEVLEEFPQVRETLEKRYPKVVRKRKGIK